MEEIANLIMNYGVSIIIVALFLWDWITNKKENKASLTVIKDTLTVIKETNENTAKSLDLLQKTLDNHTGKLDKILERK